MTFDETSKIKEVNKSDGHYTISLENSSGFGLDSKYGYEPKIGDTIELFIVNGSEIRGVFANGRGIFYKLDEQLESERKEWLENHEKEKQAKFKEQKSQLDRDYDALPPEFQARIDKFRKNNPRFRIDYESYEMFCCKEAIKIANACKTPQGVETFRQLDYNEQKVIANIDDGHSGNTMGCALNLAYWYLKESTSITVARLHGSLSPLVGSKAFGDVPIATD